MDKAVFLSPARWVFFSCLLVIFFAPETLGKCSGNEHGFALFLCRLSGGVAVFLECVRRGFLSWFGWCAYLSFAAVWLLPPFPRKRRDKDKLAKLGVAFWLVFVSFLFLPLVSAYVASQFPSINNVLGLKGGKAGTALYIALFSLPQAIAHLTILVVFLTCFYLLIHRLFHLGPGDILRIFSVIRGFFKGLMSGGPGVPQAGSPSGWRPKSEASFDGYVVPPLSILEDKALQGPGITDQEISVNARKLEDKLREFGVNGVISEVCSGPVITRYELKLEPGQKVAQVEGLARDLAVAMAVQKIRICLVEGKSSIGIEMPNPKRQVVYFKDCAQDREFKSAEDEIKVVLGKDPAGKTVIVDLAKMPHMLIAGTTGSGKSVVTNTFLASILLTKRPDEVRLILVDPKVVEMSLYNGIPHLLSDVITTPGEALEAFRWAVNEMNSRYQVLAKATCRNIAQFNAKVKDSSIANSGAAGKDGKRLPYIVIIVDEMADLMMAMGKELEDEIVRIAQKARAVGIHLILATQRPVAEIVTGLIKSNVPSQIALTVTRALDSRIIIDENGAESLLGRGDMLFKSVEMREARRVHGAFIDTHESNAIIKAVRNNFLK